jgi:hypothetical protein
LLSFEEPPGHRGKPILLTVPAEEGGSDYVDGVVRAITSLAALEDRYAVDVLDDILKQPSRDAASANGPVEERVAASERQRARKVKGPARDPDAGS